ncbi:hypothetical protein [Parasphingorhabdus cellanae]|uniref:DUF1761 domain-containing protein n=1 Tax=Parasphingorhabdus cellanae TaxID=2806553 RepID=A0ABX7T9T3_9SPHN|nr:hypothetical protein [Parasphingorhabdus cellanae]QTD57329.1 hypothetical protein J4G78_07300 [Parasphingorhabdus cellanae]
MTKQHLVIWALALVITIFISIFWHVILFEQAYLNLGVYTRMDSPIYGFGLVAWLMESTAFVVIYFRSSWSSEGISGGLKLAMLMAIFTAAASVMGSAAKVQINDLTQWFLLSGGFLAAHFGMLGLAVGWLNRKLGMEYEL